MAILPISKMSTEDKLRAIEELWASLAAEPEGIRPPSWHKAALDETEERVRSGQEEFLDWETAKKSIRRRAR